MGLKDKLEQINSSINSDKCAYQELLDSMKPEDLAALETAWEKGYSQRIILRALRSEGYKTSNESILGHKSGNCKCQKE